MYKVLDFAPEYVLFDSGVLYRYENDILVEIIPVTSAEYPYWDIEIQGGWCKYSCHLLMAQLFIPNPHNLKVVNHKDGNKHNWSLSNLEWCTQSQNILHAQRNDFVPHTTKHAIVVAICQAILQGKTNKEIADTYQVSQQLVCNIRKGRRHAQVMRSLTSIKS